MQLSPRSAIFVMQVVSESSSPENGVVGPGLRPGPPQLVVPTAVVKDSWPSEGGGVVVVVLDVLVVEVVVGGGSSSFTRSAMNVSTSCSMAIFCPVWVQPVPGPSALSIAAPNFDSAFPMPVESTCASPLATCFE